MSKVEVSTLWRRVSAGNAKGGRQKEGKRGGDRDWCGPVEAETAVEVVEGRDARTCRALGL